MRLNKPLTWLGIGLSLLGLILVFVGIVYVSAQPWNAVLTHLGSVLVGAGVVELIGYTYMSERLINHATNEILRAMKFPIREFYENREALAPLSQELRNSNELWIAWHTGTVAITRTLLLKGQTARVILTHPESSQMKELEKVGGMSADGMGTDIMELTKTLKQQKVDVRWFDGPVCNSIIIGNPEGDGGGCGWKYLYLRNPRGKGQASE